MELIDFSKNKDSFEEIKNIESVLLWGDPEAISGAEITICIPTYKRPQLLKEAIESALNQDTKIPYRIIVVDNDNYFGNTETLNLIKKYSDKRLSYYKNKENLGMYGNWNRCGELAITKWFGLLHDDDLLKSNYIEEVNYILSKYKNIEIDVLSFIEEHLNYPFNNEKKQSYIYFKTIKGIIKRMITFFSRRMVRIPIASNMFLGNVYGAPTCGMLFNKISFIKSGGFNQAFFPSADWFFLIYFANNYKVYKYKKILGIYRWGNNESLKEDTLEAFKINRERCIFSLSRQFMSCKVYFWLFEKDLINICKTRLEIPVKTSFLYRLAQRYYSFIISI